MLQLLATAATIVLMTQAGINHERYKGSTARYWGFLLLGALALTTTIWAAKAGV